MKVKNLLKKKAYNENMVLAEEEAHNLVISEYEKFCEDADISLLYTLNTCLGCGKIRAGRFYRDWIINHAKMIKDHRQGMGDKTHIEIMKRRLKERGIDYEALKKEVAHIDIEDEWEKRQAEINKFMEGKRND